MTRRHFLLTLTVFCFICLSNVSQAQIKAVTDDGKVVLLYDDGTWTYSDYSEQPSTNDFTFRNTYWGMSKAQVKESEKTNLIKEEANLLVYQGTVSDLGCLIVYIFSQEKLVRCKYSIIEKHTNRNDYITDQQKLKKILIDKYKDPIQDDTAWKNDLYRNDYQEWGFAVSVGHLVYFTKWENTETEITLVLYGENYDITLGVEYKSKELKILEEQDRQQKAANEF